MSLSAYLAFLLACVVVVIVPGPTVTLIVANSLRHGRRAGMLNVAGTQLGLALTVGVVLLGLASLIASMGAWFIWFRLAGAAYLIWLGCKLLMASGDPEAGPALRLPRGGFFLQGLAVALSNPKSLIFFGAFPAIHGRRPRLHVSSSDHGRVRDGGGRDLRHRLCAARLAGGRGAVAAANAVDHADERGRPHRRRPVAGVLSHAVKPKLSGRPAPGWSSG
jgi:hypothetical protein